MQPTRHDLDAPRRTALVLLAFLVVVVLIAAPAAVAAPPDPTMDLTELGSALVSGPLEGHLLTTVSGATPLEVPLQVQGLVTYSDGTLILFEARGPVIDKLGAIAAGMSGSPVYVESDGVDYLVGALSYGDTFTRGGTGLATPIEYMAAIEDTYPITLAGAERAEPPQPGVYPLRSPVATAEGVVRDVTIAESVDAGRQLAAAADGPVVAPLGIIEIGGARPGSAAYARIAARFARTGMLVRPASGDGTWAGAPTPALGAGSPCAMLFSQGAVWVGAAGTVTYVDGDTAMLFGHPFAQFGPLEAVLTGGWVEGMWPSNAVPYALISPRDVKGTVVQDRAWGVQARLGGTASLFPVHTTVAAASRTLLDDSAVGQWLFTAQAYPTLPADIATTLAYRLIDQYAFPGSATTLTTVVVADDTGTYTVRKEDLWSDPFDVAWYVGLDASMILDALASDPDGTLDPHVVSVAVDVAMDRAQRSARIAAVDVLGGLRTGPNQVVVSYYAYGSSTLKALTAELVIPKGTPLNGRLTVSPASWYEGDSFAVPEGATTKGGGAAGDGPGAPQTLADLVDDLNGIPRNSDLLITYSAGGGEFMTSSTVSATVATDYLFSEPYSISTMVVEMRARPRTVEYGRPVEVNGVVGSASPVPVRIYRVDADQMDAALVATVTADVVDEMAVFSAVVPRLRKTATIVAIAEGAEGMLPGRAEARVAVKALVKLSGSAPLRIQVKPVTDGTARIQRKAGGRWVDFRSARIVNGAGAVKLPRGAWTLRAKFPGSAICAAGTSRPLSVTVR